MKTHQWLLHALLRAGGLVRGGSGRHSAGMAHVRTTRGLIISALVVGSLVLAAASCIDFASRSIRWNCASGMAPGPACSHSAAGSPGREPRRRRGGIGEWELAAAGRLTARCCPANAVMVHGCTTSPSGRPVGLTEIPPAGSSCSWLVGRPCGRAGPGLRQCESSRIRIWFKPTEDLPG
jgi:hypothetical protein